jgi:ankyrin repeat protein
MVAAAGHAAEIVEILLAAGANPNVQRKDGTTPLQWSIQNCKWAGGSTRTIEILLAGGADPEMVGCSRTPLTEATKNGCLEAVKILVKAGAKTESPRYRWEPLICNAIQQGSIELVDYYLKTGADPNSCSGSGSLSNTPAIQLALRHPEIFNLLLANGADPELPGSILETAFHSAAKQGCLYALQTLFERNPSRDINERTSVGQTPLMLAAMDGHLEVVRFLLEKGANKNLTDYLDRTALMLASAPGSKGANCVELLR